MGAMRVGVDAPTVGGLAIVGEAAMAPGLLRSVGVSATRTVGVEPGLVKARRSSVNSRPDW